MIVTRTPYRVSFAGGGSDIPAWYERGEMGTVISAAINRYVYVITGRHFRQDRIRVAYSLTENVEWLRDLKHDLIREAMRVSGIDNGIEMATVGEVPGRGTGLGSSASVTVGALHGLSRLKREKATPDWLAETASYVEMSLLGRPCGKQDQYAAAFGGLNQIIFHPSGQVDVHPLKLTSKVLRALNRNLILFYTGEHRQSADLLTDQAERLRSKSRARSEMRAMIGLVSQIRDALELENLTDFGAMLNESWQRKKRTAPNVTTREIDAYYERAINAGALGGKLCGAGAGGFLLMYVPEGRVRSVCSALPLKAMNVEYGVDGSEVLFDG